MMITVKSGREIELMRQAGKIAAGARSVGRQAVRSGLTTKEIDRAVHEFIVRSGAVPSCLGYEGFPAATCISVNEEVIHGIPGKRIVKKRKVTPRRHRGVAFFFCVAGFTPGHPRPASPAES